VLYPLDDIATCVSVAPKIRRFPKIFLGTFENAATGVFFQTVYEEIIRMTNRKRLIFIPSLNSFGYIGDILLMYVEINFVSSLKSQQ